MTENLIDNLSSLIPFFQSEVASRTSKSISSYRQALAALTSFLNLSSTSPALSSSTLSAWAIYMALNGLSRKTIIYYFDIIAAMYGAAVKKGLASPTPLFSTIKAKLKEIDVRLWDNQISIEGFSRLLILTKSSYNLKGALSLAADLSLLSLLNGCIPLSSIAEWRNASLPALEPESKEITLRHSAPNRKYVFPLDQSRRTPRQLDSFISTLFSDLFRLRNLPVFGSPDSTLRSYWAYAALSAGIAPAEILSITGSVVGFPLLSLFTPATLSETRRKEIINSVASIFLVNPLGWFAMRLRPHISFEELSQRFDSLSKEKILAAPSIFYPYDEIARRTGKKMKFERKPVIRDVVFFNSRITDILPMFSKIGDLAWCYTVTGRPGGTYAQIPRQAFENFQRTIGHFTPDYEVAPIGQLLPRQGEKIEIVAGPFAGQQASFLSAEQPAQTSLAQSPETPILYRCALIGENGIEWRIKIDSRQTQSHS